MKDKKRFLLYVMVGLLLPCTSWAGDFTVENSLPQEALSRYNQSFDKPDEDLWEKASFVRRESKRANFKLADMKIENGRLRITTKTGAYSKGSYCTKFDFKGDFDVQVDCYLDFLKDVSEMAQRGAFSANSKGKDYKGIKIISLQILKNPKTGDSTIETLTLTQGKKKVRKRHFTGNFHGTLRMVRKGKDITTMYRKEGQGEWKTMCTLLHSDKDMSFSLVGQNFWGKRKRIKAIAPFTVEYDNFRINGAQGIIEEDI